MVNAVVFRGVRVFPGYGEVLSEPVDVRVDGSTITSIGPPRQEHAPSSKGQVGGSADGVVTIDGAGRVLMPGLIDAHWHAAYAAISVQEALMADPGYLHLKAGVEAGRTLLRGFTTVRDVGGPVFALKRAIDEGVLAGPRIFPSGAVISQTSGHGDFRSRHEVPRDPCAGLSHTERVGAATIADGPDQVLRAVREQLMLGASQIKVMAGGGVASPYDPLDVTQYTEPELRAAVEAAEDWGTYVTVHAYTPAAIARSVAAGVRCIEHGHLADDKTAQLMAERGVWWSLQPFLDDEHLIPIPSPAGRAKQLEVVAGTERAYELARRNGVKIAWGSDTLFDPALATQQGAQLAKMTRWFTPAQVLTMATSANAELLTLSGPRHPYPGVLGRIEVGALADLLLLDGNPLTDPSLLTQPQTSMLVIMKDGLLHKNTT
ncbi:MAG TPA: amidohydrolase family protein [Dermatophilaceae bacterium]|nr:amidohydrolase family protein [Dermatophilaceae bacterium]